MRRQMIDFSMLADLGSWIDNLNANGKDRKRGQIIVPSKTSDQTSSDKEDIDGSSSIETFGPWSDDDEVEESKATFRLPRAADQTFLDFDYVIPKVDVDARSVMARVLSNKNRMLMGT